MGSRTEKLLLEDIEELGKSYVGLRVDFGTGYGFHVPHDAGDIIVGRARNFHLPNQRGQYTGSDLYIIEEKYRSNDTSKYIQCNPDKTDGMIEFAEAIGATPVMAVRWSSNLDWSPGAEHRVIDARNVRRTDAGNINIKPENAKDNYKSVVEFFE